jgi:hypothetical protein
MSPDLSMIVAVVTMFFVIVPMVVAPVIVAPVMPLVAIVPVLIASIRMIAVMFTIMRDIGIVVPVIPNKVDRLAAGVVLATMPTPILFVTRPHMKINRGWQRFAANPYGNDGRGVDKPRCRSITEIDSSKKTGFTNIDRHADISAKYRRTEHDRSNSHRE